MRMGDPRILATLSEEGNRSRLAGAGLDRRPSGNDCPTRSGGDFEPATDLPEALPHPRDPDADRKRSGRWFVRDPSLTLVGHAKFDHVPIRS